jgi:hypothetical protein
LSRQASTRPAGQRARRRWPDRLGRGAILAVVLFLWWLMCLGPGPDLWVRWTR